MYVICPDSKSLSSLPESNIRQRNIVNKHWIDALSKDAGKLPTAAYGFGLQGQVLYLFDPDSQTQEMSVWKRNMTLSIERNLGVVES